MIRCSLRGIEMAPRRWLVSLRGIAGCVLLATAVSCTRSQTAARDDVPSGTVRQDVIGVPVGIQAWKLSGWANPAGSSFSGADDLPAWTPALATDGDRFLLSYVDHVLDPQTFGAGTSRVQSLIVDASGGVTSTVAVSPEPPYAFGAHWLGAAWAGGM